MLIVKTKNKNKLKPKRKNLFQITDGNGEFFVGIDITRKGNIEINSNYYNEYLSKELSIEELTILIQEFKSFIERKIK